MTELHYLYVFFQSNLLEIPIYYLFYRKFAGVLQTAKLVTLSNLITHPIVFFVIMARRESYIESILAAEAFAILAEAILHSFFMTGRQRRPWDASFVANLISWQFGPLLTYWIF